MARATDIAEDTALWTRKMAEYTARAAAASATAAVAAAATATVIITALTS